jgi:CheY-like chemotaxis protein
MDISDNDRGLFAPATSASMMVCWFGTEDAGRMTGVPQVKRRILVVEDEMLIGMLLEDMLVDLGHEVAAIAPRLKDALAAVDRESFDLAILDVHLHGESAFTVADRLIGKNVPFVLATG